MQYGLQYCNEVHYVNSIPNVALYKISIKNYTCYFRNSLLVFEIVLWTIAHGYSTIGTLLTCDRWVSCAIWEK